MEETELLKQFTEIANKEGYVLIPKSYYERLFNGFDKLKRSIDSARESRDNWKKKYTHLAEDLRDSEKGRNMEMGSQPTLPSPPGETSKSHKSNNEVKK